MNEAEGGSDLRIAHSTKPTSRDWLLLGQPITHDLDNQHVEQAGYHELAAEPRVFHFGGELSQGGSQPGGRHRSPPAAEVEESRQLTPQWVLPIEVDKELATDESGLLAVATTTKLSLDQPTRADQAGYGHGRPARLVGKDMGLSAREYHQITRSERNGRRAWLGRHPARAMQDGMKHHALAWRDRVYTTASLSGTYAGQALCSEAQVHHLPQPVSYAQGAAIGIPYPTAYAALFLRAHALPSETVLVHGASGGVGIAAVQIARAAGLRVFGSASSPHGKRLVAEQGAHVLDHGEPMYMDELMRLTENRGVDVIVEMLANQNLARDLGVLAPRGRVVVVGSRGPATIDPMDLIMRDASVCGMLLPNASPAEDAQIHAALAAAFANGSLRPIVYEELPLADAAMAHHEIMEGHVAGKIVLVP